jgi:GNAT superfamily N-acetyltransferase
MCREALDHLQRARGGPLFARRETGLIAKALMRPGGLDRLLADSRRRVLVGTVDDTVVGMAIGRVDDVGEASLGIIDACFVEARARGVGVGGALLEGLVSWFAAAGCRGVDVSALPGDRETKNLLEATGFKARLITMHRTLE